MKRLLLLARTTLYSQSSSRPRPLLVDAISMARRLAELVRTILLYIDSIEAAD